MDVLEVLKNDPDAQVEYEAVCAVWETLNEDDKAIVSQDLKYTDSWTAMCFALNAAKCHGTVVSDRVLNMVETEALAFGKDSAEYRIAMLNVNGLRAGRR